jgi:hypothetical protein
MLDKNEKVFKSALYPFLTALAVFITVYAFELSHFTLSIDEEFNDNIIHTISMGRWGHSFLKQLIFPEPFIPFFTEFISFILLSISCTIITNTMGLSLRQSIFFATLYASMPQFAYQLQFLNQFDTLATSLLLSSMIVFLIIRRDGFIFNIILPSFLLCISISIYQSVIFYPLSILIASICIDATRNESKISLFKVVVSFLASSVSGMILYAALTRIIQKIYNVNSDSYFTNMISWLHSSPIESIKILIGFIKGFLTFETTYGLSIFSLSALILALPLLTPLRKKIKYTFFAAALILSAFTLNIIIGGALPARAMTCLGVVFAASCVIAFSSLRDHKMMWIIPAISIIYGAATVSNLFYSETTAYNKDYRLATRIANDISAKINASVESTIKVYFYGGMNLNYNNKIENSDMFGTSFLNWDSGNSARISAFINRTGIANISPVSFNDIKENQELINEAPVWPKAGSILIFSDIVVVKLGSTPGNCVNGTYKNVDPSRCLLT